MAGLYANRGISKIELDKAVEEIIYDPGKKENSFIRYLYPMLFLSSILIVLVMLQFLYNRRLSYLVNVRTKELKEEKIKAEHAAEAKATFLANMSHEIRTPMNAILGFVEQLAKKENDPSRLDMFKTIKNSGHILSAIIDDILDISKIDSGNMLLNEQPTDLCTLFNDIKLLFEHKFEAKTILYSEKIDDNIPRCVMIDENRFKQILINIIGNAIKFTPVEGKISLDVFYDKDTNVITMNITDTGIGISKENIEKIFHPFEQEDSSITRRFGGTGLGLAISQKLVSLMDGELSVKSTVGEGSCFNIHIPLKECNEDVERTEHLSNESEAFDLDGKVLIVEDNITNQLLLGIILDELSLTYDVANNGEDSIKMFEGNADYDIILMDENMPVMNGIEAVKHIREIESKSGLKPTPIIAVTANALEGDREYFISAGMNDYVAKPYTEKKIRDILVRYMKKRS